MKTITIAAGILCLLVVSASVQSDPPSLTHTVTYVDTYTVSYQDTTTVVDVFNLTLRAALPGRTLGAVLLEIGTSSGIGDDPFQVGRRVYFPGEDGEPPVWSDYTTPTQAKVMSVITTALYNLRSADTRFLPYDPNDPNRNIENWPVTAEYPNEGNDLSIYDPGYQTASRYLLGAGNLDVMSAVPNDLRTEELLIARIGRIRGTRVYCHDRSADDWGETVDLVYEIPEPATLALLAALACPLLRRKERRV